MERVARPVNLPAVVATELRKQIERGELAPGAQIPGHRDLAQRFGISLGSVREGISMLVSEGLLETRAGRGTFVANRRDAQRIPTDGRLLDRKEVEELIEAREALELQIVVMAAQRATAEQIATLRQVVERMEAGITNPAAYSEADVAFHIALAEAASNRVLLRAMLNIRSLLKREMELSAEVGARRHGDLRFSVESHKRVVEAIEAGDAEAARAELFDIMNRHHGFVLELYPAPTAVNQRQPLRRED